MNSQLDGDERRELRWKARTATIDALTGLGGEAGRSAIAERARALGGFSPREYGAPLPEGAARKYSNPVDHALSWALTNLKRDQLVENPGRGIWRLTKAAAAPVEQAYEIVSEPRLVELRAMPYTQYLRTPEWHRTRTVALERAGHRCVLDARHTTDLEVHHNTYDRLGEELASDLAVLCHTCHRLHHRTHGRPGRIPDPPEPRLTPPVDQQASHRHGSIAPPGWLEARHVDRGSVPSPPQSKRPGLPWLRRVLAR